MTRFSERIEAIRAAAQAVCPEDAFVTISDNLSHLGNGTFEVAIKRERDETTPWDGDPDCDQFNDTLASQLIGPFDDIEEAIDKLREKMPARALVIVDVQNDFLPGGALGVGYGDEIIPVIANMARKTPFTIVTRDAHPEQTAHFDKWPVHCVAGTHGADVHPTIWELASEQIVKGEGTVDDGYSGFEGADPMGRDLDGMLRRNHIEEVFVVGLALDYCVKATALDAKRLGYRTTVFLDATRPVAEGTGQAAIAELRAAGVEVV